MCQIWTIHKILTIQKHKTLEFRYMHERTQLWSLVRQLVHQKLHKILGSLLPLPCGANPSRAKETSSQKPTKINTMITTITL